MKITISFRNNDTEPEELTADDAYGKDGMYVTRCGTIVHRFPFERIACVVEDHDDGA